MSSTRIFRLKSTLLILILIAGISATNSSFAATTLLWDTAYADRFEIDVTTGANVPDKGYVDYTPRVATLDGDGFDTAVQYIRINPSGTFFGRSAPTPTTLDLRARVLVH